MHCHRIIFLNIFIYFIIYLLFNIVLAKNSWNHPKIWELCFDNIYVCYTCVYVVKILIDSVEHQEIVRSMFATIELPKAMYVSHGVAFFIPMN